MQVAGPTKTAGTDRFGEYQRVSFEWLATSSSGAAAKFHTGARSYKDGATVVFEQSIADGADRTAYKQVDFSDGGNGQKAKVEPQPFLHFPSFDLPGSELFAEAGRAGFVTWMGRKPEAAVDSPVVVADAQCPSTERSDVRHLYATPPYTPTQGF